MSPSGPGREMSGKVALCCLVKCVSSHLVKSIKKPRPASMRCMVIKSARRAVTFSCRLVEETYVLTSSIYPTSEVGVSLAEGGARCTYLVASRDWNSS